MKTFIILFTILFFNYLYAGEPNILKPEDIFKMSLKEMLEVKVTTASKKEEKISDIPASVIIINRNKIEQYGYMSLQEILANVPGMYKIYDMAYGASFGVRGFWTGYPRNLIFLVNGVTQIDPFFNYHILSNFNIPVEAIDRIEIIRGPMSVMYGQGGFFGAVNIITNDTYNNKNIISGSTDVITTKKTAIRYAGKDKNIKFAINAGYSDFKPPSKDYYKMVSNPSILSSYGVNENNNSTEGRLDSESKYFNVSTSYNQFYTNMSFNTSSCKAYVIMPSTSTGAPYAREMAKIMLGYKTPLNDIISIDGKITYHNFSFAVDYDLHPISFKGLSSGGTRGKAEMYEVEIDTYFVFNSNLDLTIGLYYQNTPKTNYDVDLHVFNKYLKQDADDIENLAGFSQINYKFNDNFKFVGGLRLERSFDYTIRSIDNSGKPDYSITQRKYNDNNLDIIPRLAAIYSINESNVLKFMYGEAINSPSFFQNADQLKEKKEGLKYEQIKTFELNYLMTHYKNLHINASYFHNVLDNLIVRNISVDANNNIYAYSNNGGEIVTDGFELSIFSNPFNDFNLELSGTYQNSKDKRNGFGDIYPSYSPHLLGFVKASYNFYPYIFSITGNYIDKMETYWDVSKKNPDGTYGNRIGETVNGYFVLGANFRIDDLFSKGYYLNLRCSNILNKEYLYPAYVNNTWADKGLVGEPISFLLTFGRKF
ncbi:MAG: TonB-dependent receptor [Desulfobacterales bacterium]|nr:TonB-dependent receptor [Desulfobacterales bacterium]MBF0397732.1 TonB-dependent receptor [Desulfobacterales bacterium]